MTANPQRHRNEVHLSGFLARDPEIRYTTTGKAVANFTIGTTHEKRTDYHRCTAWGSVAERIGEHFKKGAFIALCGGLQTRSYENGGQKRYVTEVVVWNVSEGTNDKPLTPKPR